MIPAQNDTLIRQINDCFYRLSGKPLYAPGAVAPGAAAPGAAAVDQWLHEEAPYGILAHNTAADPRFIYANKHALASFRYTPDEILAVPSRLSASEQDRQERQRMLEIVLRDGIVYNYTGPRVDKYGNSFTIYDGIVWELRNASGEVWGQAALFWTDELKRPEWFRRMPD
ncbi:MEKHLA domain-containing protein [Dyadobacter endophyticus]|uniref:MEKHLA domain-containing protein n=1 Tax=Dyadobacter endophyticus TaxID=1749036 RepID=UPI003CEE02E2